MLKNFLKNTAKGIIKGNGVGNSAKDSAKGMAKKAAFKATKKVAKKGLLKILAFIMIPWGTIILAGMIAIVSVCGFFTADDTTNQKFITKEQEQMILDFAQTNLSYNLDEDYYGLANETLPTPQMLDNYVKFLAMNENVDMPLSDYDAKRLIKKAINGLKPQLIFEDGEVTTTTTTTQKKDVEASSSYDVDSSGKHITGSNAKPTTTTTKKTVKLLKSSDSVYGHIDYIYKTQTTTTSSETETAEIKTELTAPVLQERKTNPNENFDMLRKVLKDEGVDDSDMDLAVGSIIFSKKGDSSSWDWLTKDKLPTAPIPMGAGGFGGGYYGGDVAGIPKSKQYLQPYYSEASKLTGVPNWFLIADTECESSFDKNSVSNPGSKTGQSAYGLLQFWKPNWKGNLNDGLRTFLNQSGYTGSNDELWQKYLQDERMQILVGAWEWRYYVNYWLWFNKRISRADFNNTSNVALVKWDAPENDPTAMHDIKGIAAIYNCGQAILYNHSVNVDTFGYSNKVYHLSMKYRGSIKNQMGGGVDFNGSNIPPVEKAIIEKAINAGTSVVGNGRYVFGGGRTMSDQSAHIFDCSSFVWYCYNQAGIKLGNLGSVNTWSLLSPQVSTRISMSQIRPGDLIMFNTGGGPNTHVGIYMGDGKMVNAQSPRTGIKIANIGDNYWKNKINGVYRPNLPV